MEHKIIAGLRAAMKHAGLDALVAHSQDNVTYTAGFLVPSHATNRFRRTITIIAGDSFAAQIVVNVEENLAKERSRIADIRAYNQFTAQPADLLADALVEAGVAQGRVGLELDYLPADDYLRLRERLPDATFLPARDIYFDARMVKTEAEIEALRAIGTLSDRVMCEVLGEIRIGMTEKEVGQLITTKMMAGGCETLKCQVGSGPRSGIANSMPTERRIDEGDVIRLEILGEMGLYRSNVARTAIVGAPTEEQRRIWEVMIEARDLCKAMIKPGLPVADLYSAYVAHMRSHDMEPTLKFLGHGIGQTIHEEPYLTDSRKVLMQPNMTFTMEPFYMMPGRMGFQVEDMYVVTETGFEPLSGQTSSNDALVPVG